MEHIFEYYNYTDKRKVSLAAAQLTDNALPWWDRDVSERKRHRHVPLNTWEDMRFQLRKRYVPAYYHRDLQKKFRKLTQGSKSVEEYFEEFESLKNKLEVEESEENLMAQFVDGLNDRIARKVERQTYHDLAELLHLAVQAEQHIKRKTTFPNRNKAPWTPQPQKVVTKESLLRQIKDSKRLYLKRQRVSNLNKVSLIVNELVILLVSNVREKDITRESVQSSE